MASAGNATVIEHRIVEVEYSVIPAPEAVMHSAVQGPPVRVRCACGETFRAEDVNIYEAVGAHVGA